MIKFKAEDRIPTYSLFNCLKDIMEMMEKELNMGVILFKN